MKKFILTSVIASSFVFANSLNTKIEHIINAVGHKFPGFKKTEIVENSFDKKLQTYIGIAKIETKNNYDYLLYMYYPNANAVQIIDPMTFRMITNNPKTHYAYIDNTLKTIVGKFLILKQKERINKLEKQKKEVLKRINKNNAIIFLSKDPNKPTLLIFVDPNCPYCQEKIKHTNFNLLLKKVNVAFVLTPLVYLDKNNNVVRMNSLHPNALALSTDIMSKIKPDMTAKEKIDIIKKYLIPYNDNNFKRINDTVARNKVIKNYKDFISSNVIKGTPTVIVLDKKETKELLEKTR